MTTRTKRLIRERQVMLRMSEKEKIAWLNRELSNPNSIHGEGVLLSLRGKIRKGVSE